MNIVFVEVQEEFIPYFSCHILIISKTNNWNSIGQKIKINPPHIVISDFQIGKLFQIVENYYSVWKCDKLLHIVDAVFSFQSCNTIDWGVINSSKAYKFFSE